ncbi:MAG: hypothetical protein JFAIHJKO_01986 [Pyrinomonadaceae bacterium]|nr:hypothetical protein [Pyrinomonadaceae bacterium]
MSVARCVCSPPSPFASSAGLPSRPLRFLLPDSTQFRIALFTLVLTQRTQRKPQRAQRRCREILPCVLCGFSFAGFTGDLCVFCRSKVQCLSSILHVGSNAKNAKAFRKGHKDAVARAFSAPFAGFTSRPLRFLPIELTFSPFGLFTQKLPNSVVKHQPTTERISDRSNQLKPKMHELYENAQNARIDTNCTECTKAAPE